MKYIALILAVLTIAAYDGCGGGHGIHWTLDGTPHSLVWR